MENRDNPISIRDKAIAVSWKTYISLITKVIVAAMILINNALKAAASVKRSRKVCSLLMVYPLRIK
jgi:ferric iron reductase protein FhuF